MFRKPAQQRLCPSSQKIPVVVIAFVVAFTFAVELRGRGLVTSAAAQARFSFQDVIKMVQAAEPEEKVINQIKVAKRRFQLTDQDKDQLRQLGGEVYIQYLENPDLPYAPTPKSNPPDVSKVKENYQDDAYAAKVPPGIGAYLLQKGSLVEIKVRSLSPEKQGGLLSKLPMISEKIVGVLPGAASPVRVESTPAVFYLRLAENMKIENVTLIALDVISKEKRRQVEFTPSQEKGGKPSPKVALVRQYDPTAVGPRLYKVVTTELGTGEFMFYLGGSADPASANLGKCYDFGVN